MNARIPARQTGALGQIKQHHVLAAFCGALLMVVGVGAAIAWTERDGSGDTSVSGGPVSTFDYIEYRSAMAGPTAVPITELDAGPIDRATILGLRDAEVGILEVNLGLPDAEAAIAEHSAQFPVQDAVTGGVTNDSVQPGERERYGGLVFPD